MRAIYIAKFDTKGNIQDVKDFAGKAIFWEYAAKLMPDQGIPCKANIASLCSYVIEHKGGYWKRISFKDAKPYL